MRICWGLFMSVMMVGCATRSPSVSPRVSAEGAVTRPPVRPQAPGIFTEEWVSKDEAWVSLTSTESQDPKQVEEALLHRAAELAQRRRYTHFKVLVGTQQAALGFVLRPGLIGPSHRGGRAILIRCSLGEPDSLSVREVLHPPATP